MKAKPVEKIEIAIYAVSENKENICNRVSVQAIGFTEGSGIVEKLTKIIENEALEWCDWDIYASAAYTTLAFAPFFYSSGMSNNSYIVAHAGYEFPETLEYEH